MDFVLKSIESLRNGQKVLAKKVIEWSDAFKNTIEKIRIEESNKKEAFETKLNELEKVLNIHSDEIKQIEVNKYKLEEMLMKLDDNIERKNNEIEESIKKIAELSEKEMEDEIKQCVFDRKGYCKEEGNCKYFHSDETCIDFVNSGMCIKQKCRKRHPQKCRYDQKSICFRGESCRYLHGQNRNIENCNRCESESLVRYYCEFCSKSFCSSCTTKEAHGNNFYNLETNSVGCSFVHQNLCQDN